MQRRHQSDRQVCSDAAHDTGVAQRIRDEFRHAGALPDSTPWTDNLARVSPSIAPVAVPFDRARPLLVPPPFQERRVASPVSHGGQQGVEYVLADRSSRRAILAALTLPA